MEEQVGPARVHRNVAQLISDQEVRAAQGLNQLAQTTRSIGGQGVFEQFHGLHEEHALTGLTGAQRQGNGQAVAPTGLP